MEVIGGLTRLRYNHTVLEFIERSDVVVASTAAASPDRGSTCREVQSNASLLVTAIEW